ncbi:hypothetical protein [Streptomyces sp. Agncl-13]|uniref:NucA/NucB deoxyribonuclease domain-containing protein n=1 Tax=Streptomyces sp. Agncl-13 TaxID=3400628 RepID=UPI003A85ED7C
MCKSPPVTHTTAVMALPVTTRALADHRRRAWRWIMTGCAAAVIGLALRPAADDARIGWLSHVAVVCVGSAPVALAVGVAALANSHRMRRTLSAFPWASSSGGYARPTGYSCDEYPFASSHEGAASNPLLGRTFDWCQISTLTSRTGPGWSACMIPAEENTAAGRDDLRVFYNENRVLEDDAFYVWIVQ